MGIKDACCGGLHTSRRVCMVAVCALYLASLNAQADFSNGLSERDNGRDLEWTRLTLMGEVSAQGEVTPGIAVAPPWDLAAPSDQPVWNYSTSALSELKAQRLGIEAIVAALGFLSGMFAFAIAVSRVYL